jgi:antiviral defense system Shedu protein SduA
MAETPRGSVHESPVRHWRTREPLARLPRLAPATSSQPERLIEMPMRPPTREEEDTKAKLVKQYMKLLDSPGANEMSIKPFLDSNPSFIPTPWLLNHQLHFRIILPQFALSAGLKTDYVYLTKSSTSWWCVLVEFESPTSKFFTNGTGVGVHSDLTRGLNQIDAWRDYLKEHKDTFLAELDPVRQPLNRNVVEFRYVLVMGRRAEFENSKKKMERYAQYEMGERYKDLRIMTYDAVASEFEYNRLTHRHTMKRKGNKFAFDRYNPHGYGEHLWTHVTKDQLVLTTAQVARARKAGVKIDEWLAGQPLANFGRDIARSRKKSIRRLAKA